MAIQIVFETHCTTEDNEKASPRVVARPPLGDR